LPKAYTPADFEAAIYQRWLDADVFAPNGNGSTADPGQPPFVIIQPPPNITGSLHLGHAQRSAVEDLMVRRARMLGRAALVLPGPRRSWATPPWPFTRMTRATRPSSAGAS